MLILGAPAGASAQAPLDWDEPVPIAPAGTFLYSVECQEGPQSVLCVAFGGGKVYTSLIPGGGAGAWSSATIPGGDFQTISCPTVSFCVAQNGNASIAWSTNPTGGAAAWHITGPIPSGSDFAQLSSVSCPTTSLCVAFDRRGYAYWTATPTGPETSWTRYTAAIYSLGGLSCPSVTFCAGAGFAAASIYHTTSPTGTTMWTQSTMTTDGQPPASGFENVARGISLVDCPSSSFCATSSTEGWVLTSTNPAGGTAAWKAKQLWPELSGVSCGSAGLCVAIDPFGNAKTSTNAALGEAATWHSEAIEDPNDQASGRPWAVSCAAERLCVVVDMKGRVVVGTKGQVEPPPPPPDRTAPNSLIKKRPRDRIRLRRGQRKVKITYRFASTEPRSTFKCSLDGGTFYPCSSPQTYRVGRGKHTFRVVAVDAAGNRDPSAVKDIIKVLKPPPPHF